MALRVLYLPRVKRAVGASPEFCSIFMRAVRKLRRERLNTSGTDAAAYCYSVWLRHLKLASATGHHSPTTVLELGPGDSIGIGLSALLCGANTYYALDAARYANVERSLKVFDDLVVMFREQSDIPVGGVAADVKPVLESYEFPAQILTAERLRASLAPERVESIRRAIKK